MRLIEKMNTIFILNQDCENALIDFPFHEIAATWLEEQKSLFEKIQKLKNSELYNNSQAATVIFIEQFCETYLSNK